MRALTTLAALSGGLASVAMGAPSAPFQQLWPFGVSDLEDGMAFLSLRDGDPRVRRLSPEEEESRIVVTSPRRLPWYPVHSCNLGPRRAVAVYRLLRHALPLPNAVGEALPSFGRGAPRLLLWNRARPLTELSVQIGSYPITEGAHRGRIPIAIDGKGYASISAADMNALNMLFADLVCEP